MINIYLAFVCNSTKFEGLCDSSKAATEAIRENFHDEEIIF